ncbi:hypothetical protein EVAR_61608_1 [Eumeta japonica]|uniref:Uncharacterized protein n=1 Tax=Eumeta variegata TaxID=151549 RepID=A0A4C1SGW5_EUMVA|nr:hypothetical protein EVAR_61608_1 [Eumeta japonica]
MSYEILDAADVIYVNGRQLGELKHGVGSLGKCASRPPPRTRHVLVGGRGVYSMFIMVGTLKRMTMLKWFAFKVYYFDFLWSEWRSERGFRSKEELGLGLTVTLNLEQRCGEGGRKPERNRD